MDNLESDLKNLFADGVDKVHVLTDFDGTLTKEYVNGHKIPSVISVLRDEPGYLSPSYQEKAHQLYETYSVFEKDQNLDIEFRKAKMLEWWSSHEQLLIDSGIKKEDLKKISQSKFIQWRKEAPAFLHLMTKLKIPVVVLSASGIGEVIKIFCQERLVDASNMYYIVNEFFWDKNNRVIGFHKPIIHSLNKDENTVKEYNNIFQVIKNKTNILVLGNNIGDLDMVKGFDFKKKLTIGFLDKEEKNRLVEYKKFFDHVIIDDGYASINNLIKRIRTKRESRILEDAA